MKHAGLALLVVACAHNVPQDIATGPDGKLKGATPIPLENGAGIAKGIVTYPGGDRVDWKSIELPAGKHGTLDLTLTWQTPRPGLRVDMDVFDQWSTPIAVQNAALHHKGRSHETKIDHAQGTYFVRVFAPRRTDAGAYKLKVDFQEDVVPIKTAVDVPDPPKLPAVPPPVEECLQFDPKNRDCDDKCPDGAPSTWKGCQNTCTTPDITKEACRKTMACPKPADARVADCVRSRAAIDKNFAPCVWSAPDPDNPRCNPAWMPPVAAKILHVEEQSDGWVVTIGIGPNDNLGKDWVLHVLSGSSDTPLPGGSAKVFAVTKTQAKAKVHLTREQLDKNQRVLVTPP
jgi:hypothetical protein